MAIMIVVTFQTWFVTFQEFERSTNHRCTVGNVQVDVQIPTVGPSSPPPSTDETTSKYFTPPTSPEPKQVTSAENPDPENDFMEDSERNEGSQSSNVYTPSQPITIPTNTSTNASGRKF